VPCMFNLSRRRLLTLSTASFAVSATGAGFFSAQAQASGLSIPTAVKDGQITVYGTGIAAYLKAKTGRVIDVLEATGSLDNWPFIVKRV
jgi:TRAP-type uncharacterized transport system substrate-binding protein